ncbi:putative prolyl aminopeptidase protein [Lasiodiplodia theobromae]|uniref:AB hydrolase-1 domain-containing protein n=1 Tax=Lasiodiplodia theobromae TaxID=45133 RepID=A0A5N5DDM3_9PEZI|nr:hypothetical protein DBV05_g5566 [Lasiodiplodia theobromae]KAF9631866.1 putative prolyl aminopeptidase protein [Lasiodiplodia theobromae]
MAVTKPHIVIVPGGWHSPKHFAPTTELLEAAGYTVHGVNLASVNASPPLTDWRPDVAAIRSTIEAAIGPDNNDVVVVMHSYGGLPTQDAIKGLNKASRRRGGVVRLVFIAAFLADEGTCLMDYIGGKPMPWFDVDESNNTVLPLTPHPTFYGDVDPALADVSAATLRPHSYATFFNPVGPNPAWKFVPCTYLVCEDDAATPVEAQDSMIEYARANGCQLDCVERVKASHSPFLSQPEWTAAAIRRACGEEVAE